MFHWPLEFPEVIVKRGGFDAFVGNPPFMGGKQTSAHIGPTAVQWNSSQIGSDVKGSPDFCAFFLLRATQLIRIGGAFGFLATKTISQAGTRDVCLEQLTDRKFNLFRAVKSRVWPGSASVHIALVWAIRGEWEGVFVLGGTQVNAIGSNLEEALEFRGQPFALKHSKGREFIGTFTMGTGFLISPTKAKQLISADSRNRDILFPFLGAEDFNTNHQQRASRWAINFHDWDFERSSSYTNCFSILEAEVKPFRESLTTKQVHESDFWKFWDKRLASYAKLEGKQKVLAGALHTKYWSVEFIGMPTIFSHGMVVFFVSDFGSFSVLSSTFYDQWAREYSSSLGETLRYTPRKCGETFPFPEERNALADVGKCLHAVRQLAMDTFEEGLTAIYNRFHDPKESSTVINEFRDLHVQLDCAVARVYEWNGVKLNHGFHETTQGTRYTICESARRQTLQLLLKLNHERHEEEVAQGLHDKKKKGRKNSSTKKKAKKNAPAKQDATLFDLGGE